LLDAGSRIESSAAAALFRSADSLIRSPQQTAPDSNARKEESINGPDTADVVATAAILISRKSWKLEKETWKGKFGLGKLGKFGKVLETHGKFRNSTLRQRLRGQEVRYTLFVIATPT
jgi:hypothetical protein